MNMHTVSYFALLILAMATGAIADRFFTIGHYHYSYADILASEGYIRCHEGHWTAGNINFTGQPVPGGDVVLKLGGDCLP